MKTFQRGLVALLVAGIALHLILRPEVGRPVQGHYGTDPRVPPQMIDENGFYVKVRYKDGSEEWRPATQGEWSATIK